MLYRKFGKTGETVSVLGFGCMRLPLIPGGAPNQIDEKYAAELVHYAIDEGVNYIDTAYPYHGIDFNEGGMSEPFVAKALRGGYREKVKLATKLPSWLIKSRDDMDRYLNEQLKRLESDYIDFYLVHNINKQVWPSLKEAGVGDFLDRAIKDGRIKHAGFSFHDKLDLFREAVDYYDWSFCQIQYNYLDENFQAGKDGLLYAAQKGLGITVMEPLRGGNLAGNIPADVETEFDSADVKRTPADWALRWVWNHPEVSVVLSGMNDMNQVKQNLKSADDAKEGSLREKDLQMFEKVKTIFREKLKVNCTGCSYCMPCPSGVDIPGCFTMFNSYNMFKNKDEMYKMMYNRMIPPEQKASNCIECGICETHCPQSIKIPEELKNVREVFE